MKKFFLILLIGVVQNTFAQYNLSNINLGDSTFVKYANNNYTLNESPKFSAMEDKFTYGNLRIYMLKANKTFKQHNQSVGNYTSLQEALKGGKIKISEHAGGTVNTLEIENTSKDTIMILAGEVVTGGKQDRVMGQDVILVPKSGKVPVSVFCVEHGRWTDNGSGHQFNGYFGVSSGSVRKQAVVAKSQSQVWEKVADINKKQRTESSTGTYAAVQNSEEMKTKLPKYIEHFEKLMKADPDYIGFVAVTGNTIISSDLFATNAMFKKQMPQLLRSASLEAISNGSTVTLEASKIMDFLNEFLKDEKTQETKVNSSGTLLTHNGKKMHFNYYKK